MERFCTCSSFAAVHSSPQNDPTDLCVHSVMHGLCCSTTRHPLVLYELMPLWTCGLMLNKARSRTPTGAQMPAGSVHAFGLRGVLLSDC